MPHSPPVDWGVAMPVRSEASPLVPTFAPKNTRTATGMATSRQLQTDTP